MFWSEYDMCLILTICYYHVTYAFLSGYILYCCLNVKKRLAQNRHNILSLSEGNGIRTHNHLVRKRTLNHLAKLAKWLSCVVSNYLYGAFDCMLLSRHVHVSEWIYTLAAWMPKNSLLKTSAIFEVYVTATGFEPTTT